MNNVNKTLYIPLYGKAFVSKKGLFLSDKWAENIWENEGFSLKGKSKSKWLAYYMGIRCAVFDEWIKDILSASCDITVIHIGCGMDSRYMRIGSDFYAWYDVDFPEVIDERKKYFSETDNYKMISSDVRDVTFLEKTGQGKAGAVIMEGVSMYLTDEEIGRLFSSLAGRFESVFLLMDAYSTFAAKMSKYKNPVNEVGVRRLYGIDEPRAFEGSGLDFVAEREMTPASYIGELSGMEKFVFKRLYAGKMAKKLYKLYEYKKEARP